MDRVDAVMQAIANMPKDQAIATLRKAVKTVKNTPRYIPFGLGDKDWHLLKPYKNPIYDTEFLIPDVSTDVVFFQRQMGQTTRCHLDIVKTASETNLTQPGALATPLEHTVKGFGLYFHGLPKEERIKLLAPASFRFMYTGHRIFLHCPASLIGSLEADEDDEIVKFVPQIPDEIQTFEGLCKTKREEIEKAWREDMDDHLEEMLIEAGKRNIYFWAVDGHDLTIKPSQGFQVVLEWPHGAPEVKEEVRITCYIFGTMWVPM